VHAGLVEASRHVTSVPSLHIEATSPNVTLNQAHAPLRGAANLAWLNYLADGDLTLAGLKIGTLSIKGSYKEVSLEGCAIGQLRIEGNHPLSLTINDARIGLMYMNDHGLRRLVARNSLIMALDVPTRHSPFSGDVIFNAVRFSTTIDGRILRGPQGYTSTREHLEAIGNTQAAHLVRAAEMATESHNDVGINRLLSRIYGCVAEWGAAPGRALIWLAALYAASFVALWFLGGEVAPKAEAYAGWRNELRPHFSSSPSNGWLASDCEITPGGDECFGSRLKRTLVLAGQGMLTPLTIFSQPVVIASSMWGQAWILSQSIVSSVLWLIFAISIRRRFKIGS
jgi:hypothetical protein